MALHELDRRHPPVRHLLGGVDLGSLSPTTDGSPTTWRSAASTTFESTTGSRCRFTACRYRTTKVRVRATFLAFE
jgi:hypothetical protein